MIFKSAGLVDDEVLELKNRSLTAPICCLGGRHHTLDPVDSSKYRSLGNLTRGQRKESQVYYQEQFSQIFSQIKNEFHALH